MPTASMDTFETAALMLRDSPAEGLAQVYELRLIAASEPDALRNGGVLARRAACRFASALAAAIATLPADHPALTALRPQAARSALMLSGGGQLGNYHIGVVRELQRQRLTPRLISGSSAGAFVGALLATRTDAELADLLGGATSEPVSDILAGAMEAASVAFSQPGLRAFLERLIPDMTLGEAHAHSGRSVNIVVARRDADAGGTVLNADVAPHVLIRDAVVASCAVPYVYPSLKIGERRADGSQGYYADGARFMDGSLHADLPATWLRQNCGATNLIASVVNPFELPFLTDPDQHGATAHAMASMGMNALRGAMSAGMSMAMPFAQGLPGGRALSLWRRVLDQRVEADVIIAPGHPLQDLVRLTDHVSRTQLMRFVVEGEAAARAKMDLMEPVLRIEQALTVA